MPRSVSPPISPKTVRQPKRSRQSSKSEISIQELSQDDDCGYDGDVEVVRPDQYEEPETESEDEKPANHLIPDIDEEITRGMRQLGWRQPSIRLQTTGNSTEHNSGLDSSPLNRYGKRAEFAASELLDGQSHAHPAKRRKRRQSRTNIAQRFMKSKPSIVTDSSDRTEGKQTPLADTSTSSTTLSEPARVVDGDEMILD
jgi:hypothetical protein